jgi:hypothetical protein
VPLFWPNACGLFWLDVACSSQCCALLRCVLVQAAAQAAPPAPAGATIPWGTRVRIRRTGVFASLLGQLAGSEGVITEGERLSVCLLCRDPALTTV